LHLKTRQHRYSIGSVRGSDVVIRIWRDLRRHDWHSPIAACLDCHAEDDSACAYRPASDCLSCRRWRCASAHDQSKLEHRPRVAIRRECCDGTTESVVLAGDGISQHCREAQWSRGSPRSITARNAVIAPCPALHSAGRADLSLNWSFRRQSTTRSRRADSTWQVCSVSMSHQTNRWFVMGRPP
jgi:hypothetical protein